MQNLENFIFSEMVQCQKFDDFRNCQIWKISGIFRVDSFWKFQNWPFLKFGIFVIANFWTLLSKLEDEQTSGIFSVWKTKIWL